MSKKTNTEKALAKRTPKKPKAKARRNSAFESVSTFLPIVPPFALGVLFEVAFAPLFRPMPPRPVDAWVCEPCNLRVDLLNPEALPITYCPRCKKPMRRIGEVTVAADAGPDCIEATAEDVTHKRLPAPKETTK